jgi:hypothetical protein
VAAASERGRLKRALRDADEIGGRNAPAPVRRGWMRGLLANFRRMTTSIDVIDGTGT